MKKLNLISNLIGFLTLIALTGCVTASKYNDLEAADNATKKSLNSCETDKADLDRKLGITSSEKSELEGSVATMKRALAELEARKIETEKRLAEFRELTEKFKDLVSAGKLSIKVRNGRMMLALSSDILFASGSAQLSKEGAESITEVAGLLKDLQNRNFQIEGHTDNKPIHTRQFPSNWELASARASSVLNTMLAAGFPPEHVSVASYGSNDPLNDNSTPEKRAENRRIAIVVVPDLSGLPGFDELNRMSEPAAQSTSSASDSDLTAPTGKKAKARSKSKDASASAMPAPAASPPTTGDTSASSPVTTAPPVADSKPSPATSATPSK
jgi:chemotaxis protein MotB